MKANSPGQRAKKAPIQSYASLPWKANPKPRAARRPAEGSGGSARSPSRLYLPEPSPPAAPHRAAAPGSRTRLQQAVRGARLPGRPARRADGAASVPGPAPAATLGPHRRVRVTCERGAAPAPRRGAVRRPGTSARAAGDGGARPRPHPAGGHPARGRGAPLSSPSAGPPGERVSIAPAASRAPGLRPPPVPEGEVALPPAAAAARAPPGFSEGPAAPGLGRVRGPPTTAGAGTCHPGRETKAE